MQSGAPGARLERLNLRTSDQFGATAPNSSKTRSLARYRTGQGSRSTDTLPGASVGSSLPRAAKPAPSSTDTHFVSASTFRARPARNVCRLARLSLALRSYRARNLPSTQQSPSRWPSSTGATRCRPGDSRVRHELLRPPPPPPQYHSRLPQGRTLLPRSTACAVAVPASMLQSTSGVGIGPHRVRTTAQCLWLCGSLQRAVERRGYSLKLSRCLEFPRVQRLLGCPSGACRVAAASSAQLCRRVALLPYAPRARLVLAFTHARSGSPRGAGRFLVAQHLGEHRQRQERVERSI